MKVDISKIVNGIGGKIAGSPTVTAYRQLVNGYEKKAEKLLSKLYYDAYWSGIRNRTTDVIIAAIYGECNRVKPLLIKDTDPETVREAVDRRVCRELAMAKHIIANGMLTPPRVTADGETYRLLDGYNRVCLMIAMGITEMDVTIEEQGKK